MPQTVTTPSEELLLSGIMTFLGEGVQKTEGPYSPKNNQCKHGNYGYGGCEACAEEFFEELIEKYRHIKGHKMPDKTITTFDAIRSKTRAEIIRRVRLDLPDKGMHDSFWYYLEFILNCADAGWSPEKIVSEVKLMEAT